MIKQSECFDEEILKKANNRFYAPDQFKTALKSFNLASQLFCMHLNISFISYHHLELYNLLSNLKIKPNIIGISETKLQRGKTLINNIYYNKPLSNIISGNLSSIISDHVIKFLIEPLDFSEKSSKMINKQRRYKNFGKL